MLDVASLEKAWHHIVTRHPILRSSVCWEDTEDAVQRVHSHIDLPFLSLDWRGLTAEEQSGNLEAYSQSDRRRGFDLTKPPLLRLTPIRMGEGDHQLVWTFHHILSDLGSDQVVLKEAFTFYDSLCEGKELCLEEIPLYKQHCAWL